MKPSTIIHFIGFQLSWWSTLWLASAAQLLWAALPGVLLFASHAVLRKAHPVRTITLLMAAGVGYFVDQMLSMGGVLGFQANGLPLDWAPLWVLSLWLGFVTTLDGVFAFLKDSHAWAALAGAISGPLAYGAGSAFGVVSVSGMIGYLILAGAWAGALFVCVVLVQMADALSPAKSAPTAGLRQERTA